MNPIQTTGQAAAGFVDALKGQPLVLALIVVTFSMIGLLYYQSHMFNSQRADNVKLFVAMQGEVQKLLSQCIVPPPQNRQQSILRLPLPEIK
jgi:hypothetical protein